MKLPRYSTRLNGDWKSVAISKLAFRLTILIRSFLWHQLIIMPYYFLNLASPDFERFRWLIIFYLGHYRYHHEKWLTLEVTSKVALSRMKRNFRTRAETKSLSSCNYLRLKFMACFSRKMWNKMSLYSVKCIQMFWKTN